MSSLVVYDSGHQCVYADGRRVWHGERLTLQWLAEYLGSKLEVRRCNHDDMPSPMPESLDELEKLLLARRKEWLARQIEELAQRLKQLQEEYQGL